MDDLESTHPYKPIYDWIDASQERMIEDLNEINEKLKELNSKFEKIDWDKVDALTQEEKDKKAVEGNSESIEEYLE